MNGWLIQINRGVDFIKEILIGIAFLAIGVTSPVKPEPQLEYIGNWSITAYTHTGNCCANGNYPTDGYTVAHNTLPFGTEIYIDGVGYRTVEDRGPGYLGSEWCDLFMDSYNACVQWGIQNRDVYIVKGK